MPIEHAPRIGDIQRAADRLAGAILQTPCLPSETLSEITGCELHLKFENLQFTASFKERGALNKLLQLDASQRASGVCAMSAGNHAQGLAYHARRLSVPATIVMPRGTPLTKVARTAHHRAKVIVDGANLSEAFEIADALAREHGATLIHPFDDPDIIAGQGTLGLEILGAVASLDAIVVPIGGGGLIAGIAIAAKALRPEIRIIGVQSAAYPSMLHALEGDDTPCIDQMTIAEGIAVKTTGFLTREVVRALVDDILLVDEPAIEQAIALLQSIEKTVVEGAGAAGLAAILSHPSTFAGMRVAVPLTGGNIDGSIFASVIMRDLVRAGRILRFGVSISDRPGELAAFASIVGAEGANILKLEHDRLSPALHVRGAILDTTVELRDPSHGHQLLAALANQGFPACDISSPHASGIELEAR